MPLVIDFPFKVSNVMLCFLLVWYYKVEISGKLRIPKQITIYLVGDTVLVEVTAAEGDVLVRRHVEIRA